VLSQKQQQQLTSTVIVIRSRRRHTDDTAKRKKNSINASADTDNFIEQKFITMYHNKTSSNQKAKVHIYQHLI
jgi:hypothetical protein